MRKTKVKTKEKTIKLGKAKTASKIANCLSCQLFRICEDTRKNRNFLCSKFEKFEAKAPQIVAEKVKRSRSEEAEEDRFSQMLNQMLKSETGIAPDLRVDDRDLKTAPNFFTWCTGKDYLGMNPFAKQIQVGLHLFAEFCPRCTRNHKYVYDIPVEHTPEEIADRIKMLKWGKCPKCKVTRQELIENNEVNDYSEFAGLVGQRGGKSITVGMMGSYITHRYIKVQNPTKAFGLLDNSLLQGTFVALTFDQAYKNLWTPMRDLIKESPWFKSYHEILDDAQERYGEELYKFMDTFIQYRHRRLFMHPSGPNKKTLRGATRFISGVDEIGWFNIEGRDLVKMDADEIYTSLKNSMMTVLNASRRLRSEGQNNIPPCVMLNISSPSSKLDKIMRLEKESRNSTTIYGIKYPTWEFNPNFTKSGLQKEIKDPVKFQRDFGCNPPLSAASFVPKASMFKSVIAKHLSNAAKLRGKHYETKSGRIMSTGKIIWKWKDIKVPKVLALDAGYSNNSFALAVGHLDPEFGIIYDFLGEVIPSSNYPINFNAMYKDVLIPIVEGLGVLYVAADRWQNLKLLHDLEEETGVETIQKSVKYPAFIDWREDLYSGNFKIPLPEMPPSEIIEVSGENYPNCFQNTPISHLIFQSLTVQDNGKLVEKGDNATDDLFRAMILAHSILSDPEYIENLSGTLTMAPAGMLGGMTGRPGGMADNSRFLARPGASFSQNGSSVASAVRGGVVTNFTSRSGNTPR
jgi:hypothetical protein